MCKDKTSNNKGNDAVSYRKFIVTLFGVIFCLVAIIMGEKILCPQICAIISGTLHPTCLEAIFLLFQFLAVGGLLFFCVLCIVQAFKAGTMNIWEYLYHYSFEVEMAAMLLLLLSSLMSTETIDEGNTVLVVVLLPLVIGFCSSIFGSIFYGKLMEAKHSLNQKNNPQSPKTDSDTPDNPSSTHSEENSESITIQIDKN